MRYLSEEAERLLQENQTQLNLKKDEVRSLEDKIARLEKKLRTSIFNQMHVLLILFILDELHEANKAIKDDFQVARGTVQTLDKEKDRLCREIDLKSEENLHLTQELNAKIRRIEELNMTITEFESSLE